jgi:hypothetical protein
MGARVGNCESSAGREHPRRRRVRKRNRSGWLAIAADWDADNPKKIRRRPGGALFHTGPCNPQH